MVLRSCHALPQGSRIPSRHRRPPADSCRQSRHAARSSSHSCAPCDSRAAWQCADAGARVQVSPCPAVAPSYESALASAAGVDGSPQRRPAQQPPGCAAGGTSRLGSTRACTHSSPSHSRQAACKRRHLPAAQQPAGRAPGAACTACQRHQRQADSWQPGAASSQSSTASTPAGPVSGGGRGCGGCPLPLATQQRRPGSGSPPHRRCNQARCLRGASSIGSARADQGGGDGGTGAAVGRAAWRPGAAGPAEGAHRAGKGGWRAGGSAAEVACALVHAQEVPACRVVMRSSCRGTLLIPPDGATRQAAL